MIFNVIENILPVQTSSLTHIATTKVSEEGILVIYKYIVKIVFLITFLKFLTVTENFKLLLK